MKDENQNGTATYMDRADQMKRQAVDATLQQARALLDRLAPEWLRLGEMLVKCGTGSREVGLLLDELYLPPAADAAAAWYREHYEPVLKITHETFRWLIVTAKKMPDAPHCVADVWPANQTMFLAGGFLELPERTEPQARHSSTPYTEFFNRLNSSRVELDKYLKKLDDAQVWDSSTRESVVEVIDEHEKWLLEARAKLVG